MTKKTATSEKSDSTAAKLVVLGASVAALAASAYFFLGPDGKKHQKHAKAWAIKMKGEVVEKLEQVREVSKPIYDGVIDSIATEYAGMKNIDRAELSELVKDLKKHWKKIADLSRTES